METPQRCSTEIRTTLASIRSEVELTRGLPRSTLAEAAEAAEAVGALTDDADLAKAVLAQPALGRFGFTLESLSRLTGSASAHTAMDLLRLGEIGLPRQWSPAQGIDARQAEALRKMLLAVVTDPRLVLARLAAELVRLRHARELEPAERERLALEARSVFAPLANRLGVWQLKWELEDLAFRYLQPEEYHRIAAALNEKRADRERYIDSLCGELRAALAADGIGAEVYGRPKHIYSIYRKMQHKQLSFDRIFDVRALRIIVSTVPECYAALAVVHGSWSPIPGEFDDYIATPKDNLYRSIHTAIVGPEGRSVEVQIRTREMHEHAELGVAAHWQYKEGLAGDPRYGRKIEAVRRLLQPADNGAEQRDFLERMRVQLFSDRIYALTPKGEVVDLPERSTPLDFAYHVHSDLGHRCRGAKVNGRIVPLTHVLKNGDIVEIIAGRHPAPSRDWLAPEHAYLAAARSRAKVRAWFRRQDAGDNRIAGRSIAERELARAGAGPDLLPLLVRELKADSLEHLYQLLGEAELTAAQFAQAAARLHRPAAEPPIAPAPGVRPRAPAARRKSPVEIEGVSDLPITLARCCAPIRPQPILGYTSQGRGVTIHRETCRSLARMRAVHPERTLQVRWTEDVSDALAVELHVTAHDRRGLVRDLTDIVAQERLSIEAMTTTTDRARATAEITLKVAVHDLQQLSRLCKRFADVPSVIATRRTQ